MTPDPETELSPAARAIVEAARGGEDPSEAHLAVLRGRVMAQVGIGVLAGGATALVASSTAEAAAGLATSAGATALGPGAMTGAGAASLASGSSAAVGALGKVGLLAKVGSLAKVGLAVVALGGAATGVAVVARSAGPEPRVAAPSAASGASPGPVSTSGRASGPGALAPSAAAEAPPETEPAPGGGAAAAPLAEPAPAPAGEPEAPSPPASAAAAPLAPAAPPAPRSGAAPAPAATGDAAPAPDPLIEETQLLGRAQGALAQGRHAEALALLDEHAARFPAGALAHEREGARWLALCGSGRADAVRPTVAAFLSRSPGSPLAPRLRAACGIADP